MIHEEGTFRAADNIRLYYQLWRPQTDPKAFFVIQHGLFEHGGRYRMLAEHLSAQGYCVYAPDLRGHGLSQGKRVWVSSFSDYISDLEVFIGYVGKALSESRVFMLGHCLGSLIAINYALKYQSELSGLITSGAFFKPGTAVSRMTAARAYIFGNLPLLSSSIGVPLFKERGISRSQRVAKDYLEDNFVFHGNVSARLGVSILRQMHSLPQKLNSLHLPLLAMHGTEDLISDANGSRMLVEKAASQDKTLKLYDGFYHDIFNDSGHEQVWADMAAWLLARAVLPASAGTPEKSTGFSQDSTP